MLIAALDTETTGMARKDPANSEAPYNASLTVIIFNTETNEVQSSFNTMILPDGWEMTPEAEEVNGLSTEILSTYGIPIDVALATFAAMIEPVELVIGHNILFDKRMIASGYYRANLLSELETWQAKETYCTMKESKHIVQAKNIKGGLKNPKLEEAYEFFFDKPLDNSHTASADALAALELYFAIEAYKYSTNEEIDTTNDITL